VECRLSIDVILDGESTIGEFSELLRTYLEDDRTAATITAISLVSYC
jgi:hypothetical protein